MYIIEDGSVELFFDSGAEKRLGPGEYFGELALLTGNHLRTATAMVATKARLRVIDQESFDKLLQTAPEVSVELLRKTCTYLLDSEQRLVGDLLRRNRELERALDHLRRTREDLDSTQLLSLTDELTGLYNRRFLNSRSELLLCTAGETNLRMALILVDIDHFKETNDSFGHAIGDMVLQRIADAIKSSLRQTDFPCRIGGDEFAIMVIDLAEENAMEAARRLLLKVSNLGIRAAGRELRVTCSIGGSQYRSGEDWDSLFHRADRSLYLAKESGRNRLSWNQQIKATGG
jgi:diguanylate cyclase (GGDEF)-like protein